MVILNSFERMLHSCPEICYEDFPQASYEEFVVMEQEFIADTSVVHVFPFVRRRDDGLLFIDLYIWDIMMYPDSFEQFIICEGLRLPQEVEEKLLFYTRGNIEVEEGTMERLNDSIAKYFPQWHYIPYAHYSIGRAIEHIYFASHRSGIREILYKADLHLIAYNIDKIVSCNLIGSTPEKIVGHDMSLRLLRIMNHPELVENLYGEESMEHVLDVYHEYSGYIGKKLPSAGQWAYLEELFDHDGIFANQGFNRALYNRLALTSGKYILEKYEHFLKLRRELKDVKRLKIPKAEDLCEVLERLERYQKYRDENTDMDDTFRARKKRYQDEYEYSNEKYQILMPGTAFEMCEEAIGQGNCLMDYIDEHADGETTILFVREKKRPEKSFVTIEVKNHQVTQAYATCNDLPSKEVYEFLVEYGKKRWIYCNPYDLIVGRDWDDEEYDEELWDYAIKYDPVQWRLDEKTDNREYKQLSFEDIFPEILGANTSVLT